MDVVLNDITPIDEIITFGEVNMKFYKDIYNLQISYPNKHIYLATADVKFCFQITRTHPDLTGSFGFMVDNLYFLAMAMVFRLNTLATSWEPF